MRQVSLREFRTRGSKALEAVPRGETILLSGQKGPACFLIPVEGDLAVADRELRRAMAQASLRESWRYAEETGANKMTMDDIDREIAIVRGKLPDETGDSPTKKRTPSNTQ
jgi:antitoxin (DNA-binding transcriptional repressor) of toxin-antitoxin stability system